jgi:hypothetical protein
MYLLPSSLLCCDGKSDSALSFVLTLFGECDDALIKSADPFGSRLIVLLSDKFDIILTVTGENQSSKLRYQ